MYFYHRFSIYKTKPYSVFLHIYAPYTIYFTRIHLSIIIITFLFLAFQIYKYGQIIFKYVSVFWMPQKALHAKK